MVAAGTGLTYQWYYSDNAGKDWVACTDTGFDTAVLTPTVAKANEGRLFRCVITDAAGKTVTSDEVSYTVKADPSAPIVITVQPVDTTSVNGEDVVFHVEATGANIKYVWQINYGSGNWYDIGENSPDYTVAYSYGSRTWEYRCVVKNAAGSVTSDVVRMLAE